MRRGMITVYECGGRDLYGLELDFDLLYNRLVVDFVNSEGTCRFVGGTNLGVYSMADVMVLPVPFHNTSEEILMLGNLRFSGRLMNEAV